MVVILPDSGRGYLGKIFLKPGCRRTVLTSTPPRCRHNVSAPPTWMAQTPAVETSTAPADVQVWQVRSANSVENKSAATWLATTSRSALLDSPVKDAISTMNRYGIDALPVVGAVQEQYRIGEVRGAVTVADLMQQLATGAISSDTLLSDVQLAALPMVGFKTPVAQVKIVLEDAPAALVTRHGNIAGIVSAHDLLMHLIDN